MLNCSLLYPTVARLTCDGEALRELVLPEGKTEVAFDSMYHGDFFLVEVRNGKTHCVHKVKEAPLDITDYIFAGKLEMTVSLIVRGKVARKWSVVPIAILDLSQGFTAFDELTDLQRRVAELEEKTKITL
jgi:hypothetical protein